jgi:hypothetical protein
MDWTAFTGLATAFTGIVILVTVFTGFRQLRHLQQATQLDGMLKLIEDLYSPKLLESIEYVRFKLPQQLEDEAVVAQLSSMHVQQDHPAYVVLRWLEKIGTLARYGLVDPEPLFALNSPDYQHMWAVLRRILGERRASSGVIVPFRQRRISVLECLGVVETDARADDVRAPGPQIWLGSVARLTSLRSLLRRALAARSLF